MYIDYQAALEMSNLEMLAQRREKRCLNFALKCLKHEKLSRLFPPNNTDKISSQKKSTVPQNRGK